MLASIVREVGQATRKDQNAFLGQAGKEVKSVTESRKGSQHRGRPHGRGGGRRRGLGCSRRGQGGGRRCPSRPPTWLSAVCCRRAPSSAPVVCRHTLPCSRHATSPTPTAVPLLCSVSCVAAWRSALCAATTRRSAPRAAATPPSLRTLHGVLRSAPRHVSRPPHPCVPPPRPSSA